MGHENASSASRGKGESEAMSRTKGWRNCGCYVWRTRKPSAVVGISAKWTVAAGGVAATGLLVAGHGWWAALPLLLSPLLAGRHTAYVGQTGSRYFRDNQHRFGDSRYGASGKAWADLDPRVYPLPCLLPHVKWAREAQEKAWIFLLLPVYNTEWNTKNPRRIKPVKAQQMRWERQKHHLRFNILPALTRGALALIVVAGAIYTGWEKWS